VPTSRERIAAAFEHREPDRTPIFEYVLLSPVADAILGRPYAGDPANWDRLVRDLGWESAVRRNALDRIELAVALEHDMLYVPPNPPPPAKSPAACGHSGAPPPVSDDPVENVRRRCEFEEAVFSPPSDDRLLIYVFLREEMARRGLDLPILAPAWQHGVWTDADLMMTMLLAPETAHRHFRLATRRSLAYVEKYIALGIDMIGVGGDFAGNRPLISPRAYKKFIMPEVRTVTSRIHAAGAWAVNASDGNLWTVIEDFLLGCEVDGYCEIDFHAGMDLGRLKALYGRRITFLGNLDCGNVLSFGSPADVRKHVHECLRKGSGNGGHVLCVSNAVTASVPLRNYLALVDAYRDYFGLPLILPGLDRNLS